MISNYGRVLNEYGKDITDVLSIVNGYKYLKNNKKLHRIVFSLFNGQLIDGYVIDHRDGNKFNNCCCNLF